MGGTAGQFPWAQHKWMLPESQAGDSVPERGVSPWRHPLPERGQARVEGGVIFNQQKHAVPSST